MRKHISRTYADNKGPDQPAHLGRLISAFIVHLENQWILKTTSMYSDDPYQITVFALSIGTPYLLTILVLKFEIIHFTNLLMCRKYCLCMANSVDHDQMQHSAVSNLGLHSLQWPICPYT